VTLSSPVGGGTLLTLWKGVSALCMDAPGGRVWLDQPEGADLAAALQGLEQQDAYPRSLYAVGVTGSAEDETIAQSAAGAMVQSLSAHEARDGASSGVESLCGNRMRFTFRCRLRVPEDSAAAWGVTPDAAGEAELTRSCVLVRDAVGCGGKCIMHSVIPDRKAGDRFMQTMRKVDNSRRIPRKSTNSRLQNSTACDII